MSQSAIRNIQRHSLKTPCRSYFAGLRLLETMTMVTTLNEAITARIKALKL